MYFSKKNEGAQTLLTAPEKQMWLCALEHAGIMVGHERALAVPCSGFPAVGFGIKAGLEEDLESANPSRLEVASGDFGLSRCCKSLLKSHLSTTVFNGLA